MKFKCPKCGSNRLEEIEADAVIATEITDIDPEEPYEIVYNHKEQSIEGGYIDRYQCLNCGEPLLSDTGYNLESQEDMAQRAWHVSPYRKEMLQHTQKKTRYRSLNCFNRGNLIRRSS